MSIQSSVGSEGVNAPGDVRLIQILLNVALARFDTVRRLAIDGVCGAATQAAIHRFQRHGVALRRPNGSIEPGSETLECLRDALPAHLSPEKLHATMPDSRPADICRFHQPLLAGLRAHGIRTPLRRAHFLTQIGEESRDLAVLESPLPEDGDETAAAGDYHDRGLLRISGRAGYARYTAARGIDIVAEPHRLSADPSVAADAACWLWAANGLNAHADTNDVVAITNVITGGRRALKERAERLRRAKWVLAV
jgi:putative chitinase